MKRIILALAALALSACTTAPTAPPVSPPCALGYVNNGVTCVRWVP